MNLKKSVFIVILFIFTINSNANPVSVTEFYINELTIDDTEWKIELLFPHFFYDTTLKVIGVKLESTSSMVSSTVTPFCGKDGKLFVITPDSIDGDFILNAQGDKLIITLFYNNTIEQKYSNPVEINYGNYSGSIIRSPSSSQSICRYSFSINYEEYQVYAIDNSPTIGYANDTLGACSFLSGTIYNAWNQPVRKGNFKLDSEFTTDEYGHYSTSVLARDFNTVQLYYTKSDVTSALSYTSIYQQLQPEESYTVDIYLVDSVHVKVKKLTNISEFIIYPNPANDEVFISGDFKAGMQVKLYNIKGQLVQENIITNTTKKACITLSSDILSGIYLLKIFDNYTVQLTQKIVINRF